MKFELDVFVFYLEDEFDLNGEFSDSVKWNECDGILSVRSNFRS